jgi:ferredoxin--NADP+ reductase
MNAVSTPELATLAASTPEPHTARWSTERVIEIRQWTPTLRSFRITRPEGYRFTPGHYARLGLEDGSGGQQWRPFSMVSGTHDNFLEFVAMLVPGGKFSELLRPLAAGAPMLIEKLSLGFLTLDQLAPGRHLWLLSSGTGLGPFMSILKNLTTWRRFERIVFVHSVRHAIDLIYRDEIIELAGAADPFRFSYIPVVTRESCTYPGALHARIPQLIENGELQESAGIDIDVADSRVMVCGNPELTREMRTLLSNRGFQTSRRNMPGQMAFEKYW